MAWEKLEWLVLVCLQSSHTCFIFVTLIGFNVCSACAFGSQDKIKLILKTLHWSEFMQTKQHLAVLSVQWDLLSRIPAHLNQPFSTKDFLSLSDLITLCLCTGGGLLRARGMRLVSHFMPAAISVAKHIAPKFMNILNWKTDEKRYAHTGTRFPSPNHPPCLIR